MPLAMYEPRLEEEVLKRTDFVTAFELHMDLAFGSALLDNSHGPTLQEENGVSALYDEFNGKL